jgi:flagellar biosynthesis protein FlhG
MPLDLDYYADTYELALIEAQNDLEDFQSPAGEAEDATADAAAMLAIISEQKRQIDDLRGTVRMLTLKNR